MAVRLRRALWIGIALLVGSTAHAFAPKSGPRISAQTLTALGAAGVSKPLRITPRLLWSQSTPPLAWSHFVAQRGGTWQAAWDAATGVPTRIWGSGIPAPGATAHADVA